MKIVPAKPPYRYGLRKIVTAKELGIDVKPYVEDEGNEARTATLPEKEPETASEPVKTIEESAPEVVEEVNEPQTAEIESQEGSKEEETIEEAAPETTLKDIGFSSTARRILKTNGITTVNELKAFIDSGKTVQDLKGCSSKTREAIQEEFSKLQND